MRKNLDPRLPDPKRFWSSRPQADDARRMRELVAGFVARAAAPGDALVLHCPPAGAAYAHRGAGEAAGSGPGCFHLAPELFLQVTGSTTFRLPTGTLVLAPGQALLVPPKLLHDEQVGAPPGEAFGNVVLYAEGDALSCHLAHEVQPGRPGIQHLESRRHPQAPQVQQWLADAARLAEGDRAQPWVELQLRSLVIAAMAGVLRAIDDADGGAEPDEPALVARVRALVHNRLADHQLSVRQLAALSGCTPDYLSHVFARASGEHLVAYVTRLRMARARQLLADDSLAGKEVAWACGFATQSYFIRSFREHHGTTPSAWRAAQRAG